MNDIHYLIECFDDALNYYQVEDVISKEEFDTIYKEIKQYGRSGQIKSVQGSTDFVDKLYKSSSFTKTRKPSANSNETRHGAKDSGVQRVGEGSFEERERSSSDGSRDSQSSGENKQKYSRELGTENTNTTEYKIKTSMTMAEAKRMIDKVGKENIDEVARQYSEASDRAYEEVVHIADELVYNPKIEGGVEEVLNQILIFSILMV